MYFSTSTIATVAVYFAVTSVSANPVGKRCTGSISSLSDVAAAVACTTININSFTVDAGKTLDLVLLAGTTVNVLGDVTFAVSNWAGPLFQIAGTGITFNGNGHTFNGNGPSYWDGQGGNGGVTKPKMMKIKSSGIFRNLKILNSPVHCFSISNPAPLTIDAITMDNSAGDAPNSLSGSSSAGHNTDAFDVSTHNLIIMNSIVKNQDDCLAINRGTNITFQNNQCSGGHGISVGSISSDVTVNDIKIIGNKVTDSDNCLRIKTKVDATNSTVSGVTYTGNTCSSIHRFGVIIDQGYPTTLGTPGTGVILSDVQFTSGNIVTVESAAQRVAVNCGAGACTGTWNWSGLSATGGKTGVINYSGITGFSNSGTAVASASTTKTTTTTKATTSTTTTKATTSTTKATTSTTSKATTSTTTTKPVTTTTTTASTGGTALHYAQCGGSTYTGPTVCESPYVCTYSNDFYSQCI